MDSIVVKFTNADEWLDELRLDAGDADRKIVRVTCRRRGQLIADALSVVASACIAGYLVSLEAQCGEYLMADGPDGLEVRARADALADRIRAEAVKLGLEVRAGVFEAV